MEFFDLDFDTLSGEGGVKALKKKKMELLLLVHPDRCKHPKANVASQIVEHTYLETLDILETQQFTRLLGAD